MNRPRAGSIVAIILAAGVYLGYIGLCLGMEPLARSRFRVVSKADVRAGASQRDRDRAMKRMYGWEPYKGYLIIVAAGVIGAGAGAMFIASRRGAPMYGVALAGLIGVLLFATPWYISMHRAESQRTPFHSR